MSLASSPSFSPTFEPVSKKGPKSKDKPDRVVLQENTDGGEVDWEMTRWEYGLYASHRMCALRTSSLFPI